MAGDGNGEETTGSGPKIASFCCFIGITTLLGFKTQATPPQRPPNKKARRAIPPNRATTRIDKLTGLIPTSIPVTPGRAEVVADCGEVLVTVDVSVKVAVLV